MTVTATAAARTWSSEQLAIFDWFETSRVNDGFDYTTAQNLVVEAFAGTGKTTTIVEGVNRAPESRILLCAFNKRIADELTKRLSNPNAQAKTLHSLGFAAVLRFWKVNTEKDSQRGHRADSLANAACGPNTPDTIKSLVAKLHTKGREIAPHAAKLGDLSALLIQFECEPDETWQAEGYDNDFVETKALEAMQLASEKPADGVIDFSDMIFLPVRNGWLRPQFDLVVVDEAQDMTVTQLEIAKGVCKGRICVVGDPNQAIYGFRGADSDSLSRLEKELGAAKLGLSVTYRCGRTIVETAQRFVPAFTAYEGNQEGAIQTLSADKLQATAALGDFILSRVNAPLVSIAMKLLRDGKRARIAGRDIGAGLRSIVRKLAKGAAANSVPAFIDRVGAWKDKETARILPQLKREATKNAAMSKMEVIADQAEMLVSLSEGALSVRDIEARIDSLFTDDGLGSAGVITCSSVHRSKGLEAKRVFVLRDTLRGGTREEENIEYVAITRAIETLVWVSKPVVF